MREKSLLAAAAAAVALVWPRMGAPTARAQTAHEADTLRLAPLVAEALRASPEIAAARALWRAAEARVPFAGALEDPVLGFMLDELPVDGSGSGVREISLRQEIPFPGKRGLMTREARFEAEALREMARDTARRVVTEVKIAYWELFLLENQLATLRENQSALEDAIAGSRARYEAGLAGQQDFLLAMVEGGELDGEIVQIDARVTAARAKLNLLLDRDAASPVGRTSADSLSPFDAMLPELVAAAREARPSVRARARDVATAEAAHGLARISGRPDFMIGGAYMQMPEEVDEWRAEVAVTVPLWKGRKQDALKREASRRLEAARSGLQAERNRASASVEERYAHTAAERRIVELYRTEILPRADLASRSARANYLAGRETFLVLLESVRRRIELTKTYYEFFADAEMHLAWLEEAVGRDLGAIRFDLDQVLEADTREERR
jgi:outer membrane protein TolC